MTNLELRRLPPRRFWGRTRWELLSPFEAECGVTVPQGFTSDGLSIPVGLRWLFSPTGVGFNASVVHDYLLSTGKGWEVANAEFENQLYLDDVGVIRAHIYIVSVKIWGKLKGLMH